MLRNFTTTFSNNKGFHVFVGNNMLVTSAMVRDCELACIELYKQGPSNLAAPFGDLFERYFGFSKVSKTSFGPTDRGLAEVVHNLQLLKEQGFMHNQHAYIRHTTSMLYTITDNILSGLSNIAINRQQHITTDSFSI